MWTRLEVPTEWLEVQVQAQVQVKSEPQDRNGERAEERISYL
jgi:hypothetical protein